MPALVAGIHVLRSWSSKTGMASEVGFARLPHQERAASRIYPTCGDKPGHDGAIWNKPVL